LRKGTDRIGKVIVKGNTYKEAEDLAVELKSKISYKIQKAC
jgi:deoxyhypusine synthase